MITDDPTPPLSNPYGHSKKAFRSLRLLQTYVEDSDYLFLKTRFPYLRGLTDILLSTFFHSLVHELRRIDSTEPIQPAIFTDSESLGTLARVLSDCSSPSRLLGPSSGRPLRKAGLRDDGLGTRSVCQNDGEQAGQCGKSESGTPSRGDRREAEENQESQIRDDGGGEDETLISLAGLMNLLSAARKTKI